MTKEHLIEMGVSSEKITEIVSIITDENTILKTQVFENSMIETINNSNGIFLMNQDDPPVIDGKQLYLIRFAYKI